MQVKVLELRDAMTFIPVICIQPIADNAEQYYLLHRDGYRAGAGEQCIIMIDAQCRGAAYDPYDWGKSRTQKVAHDYIQKNWEAIRDGDVIDVEFILGETSEAKVSESVETIIWPSSGR